MADHLSDDFRFLRLAPFDALRRNINQTFADFTNGVGFMPIPLDEATYGPRAEMHDNSRQTTISIELPGVDLKDISVQVTDNTIVVAGSKRPKFEAHEGDRYRSERSFGTFYRAFFLPSAVDADLVDARLDKGVLTIKVPLPAEHHRDVKKISIKT
jgi:HSP20 family protein